MATANANATAQLANELSSAGVRLSAERDGRTARRSQLAYQYLCRLEEARMSKFRSIGDDILGEENKENMPSDSNVSQVDFKAIEEAVQRGQADRLFTPVGYPVPALPVRAEGAQHYLSALLAFKAAAVSITTPLLRPTILTASLLSRRSAGLPTLLWSEDPRGRRVYRSELRSARLEKGADLTREELELLVFIVNKVGAVNDALGRYCRHGDGAPSGCCSSCCEPGSSCRAPLPFSPVSRRSYRPAISLN
uniref:Uncharacterized protein n=1 Tax=Macrostomum lignano TaxID=282301 RepID=A0A1I8F8I8_9PLAT